MTFTESINTCFSKYATFSGRAERPEYWWFALFTSSISLLLSAAGAGGLSALSLLFSLGTFLPAAAAAVRRLHDTNHSGWISLIAFVPFGVFYVLWLLIKQGTEGPNSYGDATAYAQAGTVDKEWDPPEEPQFR